MLVVVSYSWSSTATLNANISRLGCPLGISSLATALLCPTCPLECLCGVAALSCRSVSSQAGNSAGSLSLIPLGQLTSGEMADLDGSDASPPESQGEFLPTKLKK